MMIKSPISFSIPTMTKWTCLFPGRRKMMIPGVPLVRLPTDVPHTIQYDACALFVCMLYTTNNVIPFYSFKLYHPSAQFSVLPTEKALHSVCYETTFFSTHSNQILFHIEIHFFISFFSMENTKNLNV